MTDEPKPYEPPGVRFATALVPPLPIEVLDDDEIIRALSHTGTPIERATIARRVAQSDLGMAVEIRDGKVSITFDSARQDISLDAKVARFLGQVLIERARTLTRQAGEE